MIKIDEDFLENVAIEARHNHSPRDILIKLDIPYGEWDYYLTEFDNPNSQTARMYRKGQLAVEEETMTGLQGMIDNEADGAGDAARALNKMRHRKKYDELKQDYFGI